MIKKIALLLSAGLAGCAVAPPPQRIYVPVAQPVYQAPVQNNYQPAPSNVVSVEVDAPLAQPEPVMIDWAPPPMLVEAPPPQPFVDAVWIGGYWVWRGDWVWAHGRWAGAPRPGCYWVHPYYEHRGNAVVFVDGFWAPAGVVFVPPPPQAYIRIAIVNPGVVIGVRPIGPVGVFVPPPPGSRPGLIVPAPIGTPPAVVIGAPPVIHEGMHIQINNTIVQHNTTIINNVTVVAPPTATANGHAFNSVLPAQAHLAAQQTPQVRAYAPPAPNRPAAMQGNSVMPSMTPVAQPKPYAQPAMPASPALPQPHIERAQNPVSPQPIAQPPAAPARYDMREQNQSQFNQDQLRQQQQQQMHQQQMQQEQMRQEQMHQQQMQQEQIRQEQMRQQQMQQEQMRQQQIRQQQMQQENNSLRNERPVINQPQAMPQPRMERPPEVRQGNPAAVQEQHREAGHNEKEAKHGEHAEQHEHSER